MKVVDTVVSILTECESCGQDYTQNFSPDGLSISEIETQAMKAACPHCGHQEKIEDV